MISGRREECVFTCYDGCRAGVSSTNVFLIRVYLLLVKVQANCSVPVLAPGERFLRTRPLPLLGALQAAPLLGATGGGAGGAVLEGDGGPRGVDLAVLGACSWNRPSRSVHSRHSHPQLLRLAPEAQFRVS